MSNSHIVLFSFNDDDLQRFFDRIPQNNRAKFLSELLLLYRNAQRKGFNNE